jgi:hypothetical protein
VTAAHASAEPGRMTARRMRGRSWSAVSAWPFRAAQSIWLEPAGPVPGEVRG